MNNVSSKRKALDAKEADLISMQKILKSHNFSDAQATPTEESTSTFSRDEINTLKDRITEKEQKLRKLKIVKKYRDDTSENDLNALIKEWAQVCEKVLGELYMYAKEHSFIKTTDDPKLSDLTSGQYFLLQLGINPDIIEVSEEPSEFRVNLDVISNTHDS